MATLTIGYSFDCLNLTSRHCDCVTCYFAVIIIIVCWIIDGNHSSVCIFVCDVILVVVVVMGSCSCIIMIVNLILVVRQIRRFLLAIVQGWISYCWGRCLRTRVICLISRAIMIVGSNFIMDNLTWTIYC